MHYFFKAASVIRVGALKGRIYRSYADGCLKEGLESLKEACLLFLFSDQELTVTEILIYFFKHITGKPPYNEPPCNEHLDFTNCFLPPGPVIILLHVLFFREIRFYSVQI